MPRSSKDALNPPLCPLLIMPLSFLSIFPPDFIFLLSPAISLPVIANRLGIGQKMPRSSKDALKLPFPFSPTSLPILSIFPPDFIFSDT
ncbi:unnamed protein product [Meloidogyne enterolobii]|uniref:Uncharacterized protein n=1 Tax=Meloidogyne enterolobii TaxID=390850 RepID=A0ACB0ZFH3_MELEN